VNPAVISSKDFKHLPSPYAGSKPLVILIVIVIHALKVDMHLRHLSQ